MSFSAIPKLLSRKRMPVLVWKPDSVAFDEWLGIYVVFEYYVLSSDLA